MLLNGGVNGSFGNTLLPAFGLVTQSNPKPLPTPGPAAVAVLVSCLAALGALRIRRSGR